MNDINVSREPAVFVTLEMHKRGTLDPLEVATLIGEELYSLQKKGCEISQVSIVRGIAGTPDTEDNDD